MSKKIKCRGCGKSTGVIKSYIIADDLEFPKAYHPACMRNLEFEVMKKLSDMNNLIDGKPIC
jgi:hypothetical protein